MRLTVLLCDAVILVPVLLKLADMVWTDVHASPTSQHRMVLVGERKTAITKQPQLLYTLSCVACPALLVIDHGHFQYNSTCLGLALLGQMHSTCSLYSQAQRRDLQRFAVLCLPSCYAKRWHEAIVSLRTYSFCQAAFRIWHDWHARKRALDAQSTILEAAGSSPCPCHSGRHPPVVVLVLREVAIRSIRDQAARSGHTGCRMQRVDQAAASGESSAGTFLSSRHTSGRPTETPSAMRDDASRLSAEIASDSPATSK